jgi:dTDP-6-deoxy-L-talose 4-dehydrogenase (NAD+)
MKILLTGSSGFFGRNFLDRTDKKKIKILGIQRTTQYIEKNVNYIFSDLERINFFREKITLFKPTVILHFAWQGIPDYSKANCKKNYRITKKLIDLSFTIPSLRKIILLGSCFEYDFLFGKCSEQYRSKSTNNISECKEKLLEYFFVKKKIFDNKKKLQWYWLRPFYIYGEYQRKNSLIPTIIKNLLAQGQVNINNPKACNDYLYVGEFIRFIKKILFKKISSGIYNIGSGKLLSNQIIATICSNLFIKKNKIIKFKFEDKKNGKYSCNKKINKINFYPNFNIVKGLDKTIKKYEN